MVVCEVVVVVVMVAGVVVAGVVVAGAVGVVVGAVSVPVGVVPVPVSVPVAVVSVPVPVGDAVGVVVLGPVAVGLSVPEELDEPPPPPGVVPVMLPRLGNTCQQCFWWFRQYCSREGAREACVADSRVRED